ncbi:MAG: ACT domain-containing protein, partial [Planctomycetes bacterium]|nr:ACT domain-containing protein [Planctomycetota bacterium]
LFHDTVPRIVEVDGYALELRPEGAVLVFENYDRPGVIGAVGTLLGTHGTNIANFTLGRSAPGGMALAALNLDTPANPEILARLRSLDNMKWVRQVILEGPRPSDRGAAAK